MYGFHKINRVSPAVPPPLARSSPTPHTRAQTPRAQRTSTDAQTWEFSHPKFLRGRTDLLDDIKRKSLEQDLPALKQRVELPPEVALQLARMAEDHRRALHALAAERQRVERLTGVVKLMYDMMASVYPGQSASPSPAPLPR